MQAPFENVRIILVARQFIPNEVKKANIFSDSHNITQTRPCNIQQYFTAVKMLIFRWFFKIFFLFLLKTLIVGTRKNRLKACLHNEWQPVIW